MVVYRNGENLFCTLLLDHKFAQSVLDRSRSERRKATAACSLLLCKLRQMRPKQIDVICSANVANKSTGKWRTDERLYFFGRTTTKSAIDRPITVEFVATVVASSICLFRRHGGGTPHWAALFGATLC